MKRDSGIKDRESSGIEILMADVFTKSNQQTPLDSLKNQREEITT